MRLNAVVLGCQIEVICENTPRCIAVAESFLAALQSLLSTGMVDGLIAREPELVVQIRKSDFGETPFAFKLEMQDGRPKLEITCGEFDINRMPLADQAAVKSKMVEMVAYVLPHIVLLGDNPETTLVTLLRDDLALQRAIDFTASFVVLGNVLGHSPCNTIDQWVSTDVTEYPLLRSERWDANDTEKPATPNCVSSKSPLVPGIGDPPAEFRDMQNLRHTDVKTFSMIRESLWEQAKWLGTFFMSALDGSGPPLLAPVFSGDKQAAKKIFELWHEELGDTDSCERLRIVIIRGISIQNPFAYRVVFTTNHNECFQTGDARFAVMVARAHTMEPKSDENLDRFLTSYIKHGHYFLSCGYSVDGLDAAPLSDHSISKRELHVRHAWQIGCNDPDGVGIQPDDTPIVPSGQAVIPIHELLAWKRDRQRQRNRS